MSPIPFKKKFGGDTGTDADYAYEHDQINEIEVGSETGIEEEKDYKVSGIEHDRHIMLEELKKYFKPKFYNKVCEFRWEEIRRLFGILKGR